MEQSNENPTPHLGNTTTTNSPLAVNLSEEERADLSNSVANIDDVVMRRSEVIPEELQSQDATETGAEEAPANSENLNDFSVKKQESVSKCKTLDQQLNSTILSLQSMTNEVWGLVLLLDKVFMANEEDPKLLQAKTLATELMNYTQSLEQHSSTIVKLTLLADKFGSNELRLNFVDKSVNGLSGAFKKFDEFVLTKTQEFHALENKIAEGISDEAFANVIVNTVFDNTYYEESSATENVESANTKVETYSDDEDFANAPTKDNDMNKVVDVKNECIDTFEQNISGDVVETPVSGDL